MTKVQTRIALVGILSTLQAAVLAGQVRLKHVEETKCSGLGLQEHFNNIGNGLEEIQGVIDELPEPEPDTPDTPPADAQPSDDVPLSGPIGEPVVDGTPPPSSPVAVVATADPGTPNVVANDGETPVEVEVLQSDDVATVAKKKKN